MRRSRLEFLMVVVAFLAMAAGVAGGLLAAKLPAMLAAKPGAPTPVRGGDRPPLGEELALSADQREQMRAIWEAVRSEVRSSFDQARELERKRDEAYIALLTTEQKARYEKISQDLAIEFDSLSHQRDQIFQTAVDDTKKLLNPDQRKKYEEILRTRGPAGMGGGNESGRPVGAAIPGLPDDNDKNRNSAGRKAASGSS